MVKKKRTIKVDVENEQIILGTALNDPENLAKVVSVMSEDDFAGERHKVIFKVLNEIQKKKLSIDEDSFYMIANGNDFGGFKYVKEVKKEFRGTKNIDYHMERQKETAVRLRLSTGEIQDLRDISEDPSIPFDELRQHALHVLEEIDKCTVTGGAILTDKEALKKYKKALRERSKPGGTFLPFGFEELDEHLTEGQGPGKLTTITARPSVGKSTFAGNVLINNRNNGIITGVCPQEPGFVTAMDTAVSSLSGIPLEWIIKKLEKTPRKKKIEIVKAAEHFLLGETIRFIDDPYMNLRSLDTYLSKGKFQSVFIDLWEMIVEGDLSPQNITKSLDRLTAMASYHGVHFGILHQIGRGAVKRSDKRPQLTDLKNAGAYEERSDLILALHRDFYYDDTIEDDIMEIWVLKQRIGPRNKYAAYEFLGETVTIGDHAPEYVPLQGGAGEILSV